MNLNADEKVMIENIFGTVTNQRVVFNEPSGREELSLKDVYSVSFSRKNNRIQAVIFFIFSICILLGLIFFEGGVNVFDKNMIVIQIVAVIIIIVFFLLAIFHFWGYYVININEAGDDRIMIKVKLLKSKKGREFSEAIEEQVYEINY